MYKAEGIGSFWKGIAAPLMVETPKRAWKFCTFENFKNALNYRGEGQQPSPLTYSMAGFLAGATEGIIVNPFEAIKVTIAISLSYLTIIYLPKNYIFIIDCKSMCIFFKMINKQF